MQINIEMFSLQNGWPLLNKFKTEVSDIKMGSVEDILGVFKA